MRDRLLSRWRGIVLSLVGVVAIVWLAAAGQLVLYIHPRYVEFTVIMAVIAGAIVIAAFAVLPRATHDHDGHDHDGHDHDGHDHDEDTGHATGPGRRRREWIWTVVTALIVVGTVGALLVLPPATLTSATVDQRDLNASAALTDQGTTEAPPADLVGSDTDSFTVKDWASLLRQGAGEDYFAGKTATLTGFVTPDPDDSDNVFYIARFVVTCCAVDAQPVGVPVYLPGWADDYAVDSWVTADGGFGANPSVSGSQAIVFEPTRITATDQPAEPYVY
ncbi:TIGR03943 family protein [Herbiconiux sp. CPCC 205763]|uniref:TIGR03943 family protein n=1 Tax=Herbiconiux aconitum TaxID=2970913 RepID=A0ABT2GP24_9MICO|nr:TIGR03943 family protein [Herbiconiux aconitum]MCS5717972.1 TIGR03943 family protein [Herbiconiux aconitum]